MFQKGVGLHSMQRRVRYAPSAPGRKGCRSPVPAPRTRAPRTLCTSPVLLRRTPSTSCRRTRCWPSPITGPSPDTLPRDGGDAEASLAAHASAGIDLAALAAQLQTEGVKGFADSRHELLNAIEAKSKVLA